MRLFPELTLAALVAGVGVATWVVTWTLPAWPLLLLVSGAVLGAVVLRLLRCPAGPVLLAAALLLGVWRTEVAAPSPLPVVPLRADVSATMLVVDAPQPVSSGRVRFQARVVDDAEVAIGNVPAGTNLLVYALPPSQLVAQRPLPHLRYGDTLRLTGRLERPEPIDDFDYAAYLESQGISAVMWVRHAQLVDTGGGSRVAASLHRTRGALARSIQRALPAPQSGLAQALLLGIRAELPQSLKADFRDAGMSHLLAISGLHVGVVMALSLAVVHALIGRRSWPGVLGVATIVWVYAALSGLDPPVVRAAVMGTMALGQTLLGRGVRGTTALLLAGAAMLAVEPSLMGSLSFLLSFTAMAGVIVSLPITATLSALVAAPLASSEAWPARWVQYGITLLVGSIAVSVMTTVATMPLVAMHFGVIPLMSVAATILAMPALPAALVGAALTASVGLIAPPLAALPAALAWAPLSWLMAVAEWTPLALLPAGWFTTPVAAGWYLGLGLLIWVLSSRLLRRAVSALRRQPRWRPNGAAATLAGVLPVAIIVTVLLVGQVAATSADGWLHVYALDIGQGDAILVVTPDGRQLLIDGGPDGETTLSALGPLIPPTDRNLDVVAATHLDSDHVGGLLPVLQRYRTGVVLQGAASADSALQPQWRSALDQRHHQAVALTAGHRVALGRHVILEVLSPPAGALPSSVRKTANNGSLVLRLTYGDVAFLFTGDVEADMERRLVGSHGERLRADVLKVAHHGSRTSTTPAFLRAVNPRSAVISAGRDNRFGHPHADVVTRLETAVGASNLFSTDMHGTVEFISNGKTLWVRTGTPPPQ